MGNLAQDFFRNCRERGGQPRLVDMAGRQVQPENFQHALYAAGLYRFYCDGEGIDPRDGMYGLDYGDGVLYGFSGTWIEVTRTLQDPPWKKFVKPALIASIVLMAGATGWVIFKNLRKKD